MIQRFQTVFLFLAALLTGGQYFAPFANMLKKPEGIEGNAFSDGLLTFTDSPAFMGVAFVAALFCLLAIFRYQNRTKQISTTYVAITGVAVAMIGLASTGFMDAQKLPQDAGIQIDWGGLLPLAALVCLFLALRFIRKDEALVRSADRLR